MAQCPPAIMALWDRLVAGGVYVPKEVWHAWDRGIDPHFSRIRILVGADPSSPLSVKDAQTIMVAIAGAQKFFSLVRRSGTGTSYLENGVIYFDPLVKDILAHHIGNDLYKIALITDTSDSSSTPIPPEVKALVAANLRMIAECVDRIRHWTRSAA